MLRAAIDAGSRGDNVSALANLPPAHGLQERRTTPDHESDLLREDIIKGLLQDCEELNQVALSEHFSVSRVPIREALRQLQAEGLVRQEAHRRAVVTTLSHDHIVELFDLRVALETYMLRRSVAVVDDDTLAELEARLQQMAALSSDDHERWLEANREFLARHPEARGYSGFGDFGFRCLEPEGGHLVAGFGRIVDLTPADLLIDLAGCEELIAAESEALTHVNADHGDVVRLYATGLCGAPDGAWRMTGIDPEGADLMSAEGQVARLDFADRVRTPGDLRRMLRTLAERARAAAE
jgi:Mn-dependent DtxR family transcriptional regulator